MVDDGLVGLYLLLLGPFLSLFLDLEFLVYLLSHIL